ncbi:MAG: RNA polymerase sigma factor [Candidatus Dormibacteria bacterium]
MSRRARTRALEIEECAQAVRRYCVSRLGAGADAEDAAQNAFLRYLELGPEVQVENPEAWLITASRFTCADVMRRRVRDEKAYPRVDHHVPSHPEDAVVGRMFATELLAALRPAERRVLGLLYLNGFRPAQAAQHLRTTDGALRVMALRARRRARELALSMDRLAGIAGFLRNAPQLVRARALQVIPGLRTGLGRLGLRGGLPAGAWMSFGIPALLAALAGSAAWHGDSMYSALRPGAPGAVSAPALVHTPAVAEIPASRGVPAAHDAAADTSGGDVYVGIDDAFALVNPDDPNSATSQVMQFPAAFGMAPESAPVHTQSVQRQASSSHASAISSGRAAMLNAQRALNASSAHAGTPLDLSGLDGLFDGL